MGLEVPDSHHWPRQEALAQVPPVPRGRKVEETLCEC